MRLFSITLRRAGPDLSVDVQASEPGSATPQIASETLKLDLAKLHQLQFPRNLDEQRDYGTLLGTAIFTGGVASVYGDIRSRMQSDDVLHVTLSVEDSELKSLRWERLCAPAESHAKPSWNFLRLQQNTPFSIDLRSATQRRYPAISRVGLKALVVVIDLGQSRDDRLAAFDAEKTVAGIRSALGDIPCRVLASSSGNRLLGADGLPTLDAICEWLTRERFAILHLVCHGEFKKWNDKDENGTIVSREDTFLYLHQASNASSLRGGDHVARTATSDILTRFSQLSQLPHLAFLCSCSSASSNADTTIGGFGERLVSELAMPAVIAMREPVAIMLANRISTEFYRFLKTHGVVDLALTQACAGQASDSGVLIPALFSRLAGNKLFDDTQELTTAEWSHGLDRLNPLIQERSPVLKSSLEKLASTLRPIIEIKRHTELSTHMTADAAKAEQQLRSQQVYLDELCQDFLENSFVHVAKGLPLAIEEYDSRCPFPGLGVFDKVETDEHVEDFRPFFFGRDDLIDDLQGRISEPNFVAVVGGSGSGKSSLVRAGLIGALQRENPDSRAIIFVPGKQPLVGLDVELQSVRSPQVIIVDQFEEVFTLCLDTVQREQFVTRLLALSQRIPIVITMRDDFLGDCIQIGLLNELFNSKDGQHLLLVRPLTPNELIGVVSQQAAAVGVMFDSGLKSVIFDDLGSEPGMMPLLQHCMRQLWLCRHGRWLRLSEYQNEDRVGGIKGAIAKSAETVYRRLKREFPQVQTLFPYIFERLTRINVDAEALGGHRDTRRRVDLSELTPSDFDPKLTHQVVSRLADERLLMIRTETPTSEPQVEFAHEALLQKWPRLQGWLDDARADSHIVNRIRQNAQQYADNSVSENVTLRGIVLQKAIRLADARPCRLSDGEVNFVRLCDREEKKAKRAKLYRRILAVLGVAAVLALIVGLQIASTNRSRLAAAAVEDSSRRAALTAFAARENGESVFAANLFARAAAITTDDGKRERLQLAASSQTHSIRLAAVVEQKQLIGVRGLSSRNQIIAWSSDGSIRIFDATGNHIPLQRDMIHQAINRKFEITLSQDQSKALSWSPDGLIQLWDLTTQARRARRKTTSGLLGVQFIANNRVASWYSDGHVSVYDASSIEELEDERFSAAERLENDVQFSADGTLAFAWFGNQYVIRDLEHAVDVERKEMQDAGLELFILGAKFIDNSRIVVWEESNGLHILDSEQNNETGVLSHNGIVRGCDFFASKDLLLTWSADNSARLWTLGNPAAIEFPIDPEILVGAAYDPSNDLLTTWSRNGVVDLWKSTSRSPVASVKSPGMTNAMLDNRHRLITWGGTDGSVAVWDVHEPKYPSLVGKVQHSSAVSGVISSDDQIWTWCRRDDSARLWEMDLDDRIAVEHRSTIGGATWIQPGRVMTWGGVEDDEVASGGNRASVREWDLNAPSRPSHKVFLPQPIRTFSALAPSQFIAIGLDNRVHCYRDFSEEVTICDGCDFAGLRCDKNNAMCCIWTNTGDVYIVRRNSKRPSTLEIATNAIRDVGINASGDELVLCCENGVYACSLSTANELIAKRVSSGEAILGGRFSEHAERLVYWDDRGNVTRWSREAGPVRMGKVPEISGVSFSPHANVAIVWGNGVASFINADSSELEPLEFHMTNNSGAIVTSTRVVTWGGNDVRLSSVSDRQPVKLLKHPRHVSGVIASPDETILLSYGHDATARFWDAQNGDLLVTFQFDEKVKACEFQDDSLTFLAVLEGDKTIICKPETADPREINLATGTCLTGGSRMEVMNQIEWEAIRRP